MVTRHYDVREGLAHSIVTCIHQDTKGYLWFGMQEGLSRLDGYDVTNYGLRDGLKSLHITTITEDRQGRLWVGTHGGVARLIDDPQDPAARRPIDPPAAERRKFANYMIGDNTASNRVGALAFDSNNTPWCLTETGLYHAPGGAGDYRFEVVIPYRPAERSLTVLADREGRLWFGIGRELVLVTHGAARKYETTGLGGGDIISLAEAPQGRLLVATRQAVFARSPAAGTQSQDRWKELPVNQSPAQTLYSMLVDSTGALWLGARGLIKYKDGQSIDYSTGQGLRNNLILALCEDREGNIWLGTDGGGATKLAGEVNTGVTEIKGLEVSPPPLIYLSRVQADGQEQPLPERGAQHWPELTLKAETNDLQIQYLGLSFQGEQTVRYQHKLEGIDSEWSPPSENRWSRYTRLPSGSYRFLVRATNREHVVSRTPAVLAFHIPLPYWQQGWFRTFLLFWILTLGWMLYRVRVRRLVNIERVRQQIAMDLHDNMGSGLSQIAILSEVAKRDASPNSAELLEEMANLARAMRDSMSDIVWAVDPRKDRLADLIQRLKQAAFLSLEAEGLTVRFDAPSDQTIERISLEPDRRQHLLLVFKEAVTNIARHARATRVHVEIKLERRRMRLMIQDDGQGFDPKARYEGHGLQSLRQRAQALQAQLEIISAPGAGTTIRMRLPLKKH